MNRAVVAVTKAILSTEMGGFQSYYVDFTPYISSDENSLKNALSFEYESKVDYSATFDCLKFFGGQRTCTRAQSSKEKARHDGKEG